MAAAAKLGGKAIFSDSGHGQSKRKLSASDRKSSVDGIDSKESRAVINILSKCSIHAEAETLFKNFDKNSNQNLDQEEFRRLLRDLDENKRDPLPANFDWAWTFADKDKDGVISQEELVLVISKYRAYLKAQPDILKLIKKHDTNSDRILDTDEMKTLLQGVVGSQRTVTRADVDFVMQEVKNVAKVLHSRYNPTFTSDPDILSKAITTWWFTNDAQPPANPLLHFVGFAGGNRRMGGSAHSLASSQAAPVGTPRASATPRPGAPRRFSAEMPDPGLQVQEAEAVNLRFWEKEFWAGLWERTQRTAASCGCALAVPRRDQTTPRREPARGLRAAPPGSAYAPAESPRARA